MAVLNASRSWAFMDRRKAVLPEDVQAVLSSVAGHRLKLAMSGATDSRAVVAPLLAEVAIP
jgi:MoxR-like ATPase